MSASLSIPQYTPAYPISHFFPQEEVAQSKALDQIYKKKQPGNVRDTTIGSFEDEDWVVADLPSGV